MMKKLFPVDGSLANAAGFGMLAAAAVGFATFVLVHAPAWRYGTAAVFVAQGFLLVHKHAMRNSTYGRLLATMMFVTAASQPFWLASEQDSPFDHDLTYLACVLEALAGGTVLWFAGRFRADGD